MRVIIAGGRYFTDMRILAEAVKQCGFDITEIVCGDAPGADTLGFHYGNANNIPVKRFPAKWSLFGNSAGPRRNREMAEYADALIALPGGRGTANMIDEATKRGLPMWCTNKVGAANILKAKGWTPYE